MHIVRVSTEDGPTWGVVEDRQVRRLSDGPFGSLEVAEALGFLDDLPPLGPWIVSGIGEEEIGELEISCTVNGELRQRANTQQMVFSPAFLIAYITQVMTLEPGDIIMTGTPSGVGPLHPGDSVEVSIDGVGTLTNQVA